MVVDRHWLALVIRDWIHQQEFSRCSTGTDTCPDWPMAYDLADHILDTHSAQVTAKRKAEHD